MGKKFVMLLAICVSVLIIGCGRGESRDNYNKVGESENTEDRQESAAVSAMADTHIEIPEIPVSSFKEENCIEILLGDGESSTNASGVKIDGDVITITESGAYLLKGTLSAGQVVVDMSNKGEILLVLQNTVITGENSAPIYIKKAGNVFLTLSDGSVNELNVRNDYVQSDDNHVDAAIFSKSDLILNGGGTLKINAEYGHGIVSKDTLSIIDGNYEITANSHGMNGKDCTYISGGTFVLHSKKDGIHADSDNDGKLSDVIIAGGSYEIASDDDGIHADGNVLILDGDISINKSYEGIEGSAITIKGGKISIVASDDGINAGGGSDADADQFASDASKWILIEGGELIIDAEGDGIDSNGNLTISGGTIYVNGPVNGGNGAIDYNGEAVITGGTVVAAGSSDMAEGFGSTSTQGSILYHFTKKLDAGVKITLTDESGAEVVSYSPTKQYQSVVISTPDIVKNGKYTLTAGNEEAEIEMTDIVYSNGRSQFGQGREFRGNGEGMQPPDMENGEGMQPPDMENGEGMQPPDMENKERMQPPNQDL